MKCIVLFESSHLHVHLEKLVVVQHTQPLQPHDKLDASLRDHRVTVCGESDESFRETFREPENVFLVGVERRKKPWVLHMCCQGCQVVGLGLGEGGLLQILSGLSSVHC